jgi:carbamoyltransferase
VAPRGLRSFLTAMPVWLKEKLFTREEIRKALGGYAGPVLFAEHHESHAASAFYPSPFAARTTPTGAASSRSTDDPRGGFSG